MFRTKRIYEPASPTDGTRILVDRLWPRGISKATAHVDRWWKEIAPSDSLRKWYGHAPERFSEFRARYRSELRDHAAEVEELCSVGRAGTATLLFAAREAEGSNAKVLKEFLDERPRARGVRATRR